MVQRHGGRGTRTGTTALMSALAVSTLLALVGCSSQPGPPPPGGATLPADEQETSAGPGSSSLFDQALDCLPGTWEVDKSSEFWETAAGDADEVSGTFFIMFDPAGGFGMEYERWHIFTDIIDDIDYSVDVVWDGMVVGEYTVGDDGMADTTVIDSSATITTVMSTPQGDETDVVEVDFPVPTVYQCDGDQITGFAKVDGSPVIIYNLVERTDE